MLIARTGGLSRVLTSSFLVPPTRSSVPVTLQQEVSEASMSTTTTNQQQPEVARYEPGQHSIAYVTTPNENSAKELARKLVERKLAACVNIIPGLTSVYEWEGKLNEDHETLLMIKTRTTRVDELAKFVRENHPYSVAEVISVPIENGNPPYLEWLSRSVPKKK
uniref:Putative conserved secreted protein n=1 Tax=Culex tarsalis TaxID=7177 RepID=A0A1Q3FMW3_CULTA